MSVYAQLMDDEIAISDYSNYEIAAFVGDECRGIAEVKSTTKDGQTYTWLYFRVRSNVASGEKVTFKAYDKSHGKTLQIEESIDFVSQGQVGLPSSPSTLTIRAYTLGDVNDDDLIDIADIVTLVNHISGTVPDVFVEEAADVNQDNIIDVADIVTLVNMISNQ